MRSGSDPHRADARCAERASEQHGCLAVWQALDLGLTRAQVASRRASGRWIPLRPRVDAIAGSPSTPRQELVAGVLTSGRAAVASHLSALWLHGLVPDQPGRPEVTIPGTSRVRPVGVTLHRTRSLADADRQVIDGIPVTSLPRTLVDLAARLDPATRTGLVDEVVIRGLVPLAELRAAVQRLGAGRRGAAALAVDLRAEDVGSFRSVFERRAAASWADRGLPAPQWNVRVRGARGQTWRVDALFVPWPVVAELDGRRWHQTAEAFQRDREMDRGLRARGIEVLRFTWTDLTRHPDRVADEIAAAIGRAMIAGRRLDDLR